MADVQEHLDCMRSHMPIDGCFQAQNAGEPYTMSSKSTPVLSHAISHFEMFMTDLERLGEMHKILRFWTEIGVHWATKYYIQMDNTAAYIVTMCKFLTWYYCSNLPT